MSTQASKKNSSGALNGWIVIPILLTVAICVYMFVFGNPDNFIDGATKHEPKPGNYFGIIYKGGPVVPVLFTLFLMVLVFAVERILTIRKAYGTGSLEQFLQKVKTNLSGNNIDAAIAECSKQKGSVANVIHAGLNKYKEMETTSGMTVEQKVLDIQKEIEESTTLELPMLEKNLPIIATIASIGTLIALFGTVLGMIRAFAALATSGTPDPAALATGISEALINTALGIFTSALAIIAYNFCTGMIDKLTYGIDEIGFSITQSFAAKHNK